MLSRNLQRGAGLMLLACVACSAARVTPQPAAPVEQLNFEIQTATPTISFFDDAPSSTVEIDGSVTPPLTATISLTSSLSITATRDITTTALPETAPAETPTDEP